ncbi:lysin A, glycosyl hydrolase domain [Gordonia phage Margaret]|nr:lysin A, glycosyl hydrolase domain [Gordonia phage Margaret]
MSVYWSDTSQFQGGVVNEEYPHPIYSFRTNSGSVSDTMALANATASKRLLDAGKLKAVIAYYFFRPGQENCDLHRRILEQAGLWGDPRLVSMIDVESGNGSSQGPIEKRDHSVEINDEVRRMRGWYGNPKRVIGYLNGVADPDLWKSVPADLAFVTPSYSGRPGQWASPPPPRWLLEAAIGHQFTDHAITKPWKSGTDLNFSPLELDDLLGRLGVAERKYSMSVEDNAKQLQRWGNVRRPVNEDSFQYLPKSWRDKEGPQFNDMVAAIANEIVWDGYSVKSEDLNAFLSDDKRRSLVGLVLTLLARQARTEGLVRDIAKKVGA